MRSPAVEALRYVLQEDDRERRAELAREWERRWVMQVSVPTTVDDQALAAASLTPGGRDGLLEHVRRRAFASIGSALAEPRIGEVLVRTEEAPSAVAAATTTLRTLTFLRERPQ